MLAVRMHAFGGPEVLVAEEVERPQPAPTEVLVRVLAAGLNPVDWKTRGGGGMSGLLGFPPLTLGWDVSGVVEEVGFGVTRFKVGDEVFGMVRFPHAGRAYAEYVTAPSRHLAPKPAVSHVEAGAAPLAALTAWQALIDTAAIQPGQRVLIHGGGGGVGHLAVQIARERGATVIATSSVGKLDFVRGLGAHEVVDHRSVDFQSVVDNVDIVLDTIGGDYVVRSIKTLKPEGLLISIPSGLSKEQIAAAATAGVRATGILVEPDHTALEHIATLIDDGRLHVEVEEVFALEQAAKAHELGEQGHTRGKLVFDTT